jgi:dihydropteroate synthase
VAAREHTSSGDGVPLVRVRDARLTPEDGPARLVVSRLRSPQAVADALAPSGARAEVAAGRVHVVTTPSRLVDATGRALGRSDAEALRTVVEAAIAAWHAPAPDLAVAGGRLACSERVLVMGVLNVTPDSFSDGGDWYGDPDVAVGHGLGLVDAGADIVDVGGESTRPGAEPVPQDEEVERVAPVVAGLAKEGVTVSVDTRHAAVAADAVAAGAAVVNDVSGGAGDPHMLATVADLDVPYVIMHMRGDPRTMQDDPRYDDVVAEVFDHLGDATREAVAAGVSPEHVVIDPGIGFGKTYAHNLQLLRHVRELRSLGRPVLVGASRKSFIGHVTGVVEAAERVAGSVGAAAVAAARGAAIVRVHDVAETVDAVRVADAIASA